MNDLQKDLIPTEIVDFLDRYIVGQRDAKRSVAIALRNRWRRMQVSDDLREEIIPKNIIMIGPTGVGKTEIARRISKLVHAPFVKVEASKFTEVGYVGRDVESMIRDLADIAIGMQKSIRLKEVRQKAEELAELRLLDHLIPPDPNPTDHGETESNLRQKFLLKLRKGELEDRTIEIQMANHKGPQLEFFPLPGNEGMDINLQDLMSNIMPKQHKPKKITVKEARVFFEQEEAEKLINNDDLHADAIKRVEQSGIIFLDEIDKICSREGVHSTGEVSREGVQRDLLPIVEGSRINTKYGPINTDHILFIAAGAFHSAKPSDLVPELQGRFPIRVELQSLTKDDFVRILKEPKNSLVRQYIELLQTEGVTLHFTDEAIAEIARIACDVNEKTENIGARRLHSVLERLLDEVSFAAPEMPGQKVDITKEYVLERLSDIAEDQDLSRYIL